MGQSYIERFGLEKAEVVKDKLRLANIGKIMPVEVRSRIGNSLRGRKRGVLSDAHRKKISYANSIREHTLESRLKQSNSMKIRYRDSEFKKFMLQRTSEGTGRHPNNFELKIKSYLDKRYGLEVFKYVGNGVKLVNNASPDFISERLKIVVLCNGVYWHLGKYGLSISDENKRLKESKEVEPFLAVGYKVIFFWEDEIEDFTIFRSSPAYLP